MAITKLLRLKESRRGNPASHLKHNLFYICDPKKTGGGAYIGGNAGTMPEIIYDTMVQNKKYWEKEDGSQGFHYVISFPPEIDITREMVCQIAEDFAKKLLGDRFYYAYAVHDDQKHMHAHITFDSVSFTDGYKFHSPKGDWERRIQPITDEICRKYDLPPLYFNDEKMGKSYGQWKSDKGRENGNNRNDVTWHDLIRDDIDEAIGQSSTFEDFLQHLKEKGYRVCLGKYLSLQPFGKERAVRSSRLGKGYRIDEIRERIKTGRTLPKGQDFVRYGDGEEIRVIFKMKRSGNPSFKMTPFQKRYLQRWANSYLRNKPGRKDPWMVNADVIRIRKLSGAIKYMVNHDIKSFEDLGKRQEEITKEKAGLQSEKEALKSKLYRRFPLKDLARYEKLKKNGGRGSSDADTEQMALLYAKIDEGYGMDRAIRLIDETREKLKRTRMMEKSLKAEEQIISDAKALYYDMPPSLERDNAHERKGFDSQDDRTGSAGVSKQKMERTRISIHRKLIYREDETSCLIKIPGRNALIRIPKEDTYLYRSGEILSAFLYDDAAYSIFSLSGDQVGEEKGKDVKEHFDRREDRFRTKGR